MMIDQIEKSRSTQIAGPSGISIEQLHATVNRYCLSITKSGHEAEDLVQDTWLKALPVLGAEGHANPEAFLLRIAKTTWIDRSRKKDVLLKLIKDRPGGEMERANRYDSFIEIERVFHALVAQMPPLQRSVFLLRDVLEFTTTEAAQILRTTEGAIKAALHRARQSLDHVKQELLTDMKAETEDEAVIAYVQALANAYRMTDLTMLIELMKQGELVPAVVSGAVGSRIATTVGHLGSGAKAMTRANGASMLMAA